METGTHNEQAMKTIQMTIDEPLLAEVDRVSHEQRTTCSAFIREALEDKPRRYRTSELDRRHAETYARHPVQPGEFDVPLAKQAWPEE